MTTESSSGSATKSGRAYHVECVIGRGGFGTVYRARLVTDGSFRKAVALKVLHPEMERIDEVAQRMRDEARLLGLVSHRAIVQCDGLVQLAGRWAIVMEHVEGVNLLGLIRGMPIPPGPALEMVAEVAGALHQAWTSTGPDGEPLGILHRDIKPSNIKLTAAGAVKLLDFGIARADFEDREASTGLLVFGSETYLSPERLDRIDSHAGDVYALGCVLFEALTQKAYGRSSSNQDRYQAHLAERITVLRERMGHLPPALLALVEEMLAFDPKDRPTARDVEWRCSQLQAQWPGERLRDWAEQVVPQARGWHRAPKPDELVGSTLWEQASDGGTVAPEPNDERSSSVNEPEIPTLGTESTQGWDGDDVEAGGASSEQAEPGLPPEGTPRRISRGSLVGLAAAGILAAVLVAVFAGRRDRPTPVESDDVVDELVLVPPPEPVVKEPVEPVVPQVEADDAPVEGAPPVESPKETVAAQPVPQEKTQSAPVSGSHVNISGDAVDVVLVGAGSSVTLPGRVPAGSYTILATFPGHDQAKAGEVNVLDGGAVELVCKSGFRRCQVR